MIVNKYCLFLIALLCVSSCTTTQQISMKNGNHFPIRIVTGTVQVTISGYIDSSNSKISMDVSRTGKELQDKEKEYMDEISRVSVKNIEGSIAEYTAGEYIFHKMQKNEVVTVGITLISKDSIIEFGGKLYHLTEEEPVLRLVILE